ncbi:MAG: hypothetical protein AAF927_33635 [Bacteroidota bacterium]
MIRNLFLILPLLFLLACEPQGLPDLTLANIEGKWDVSAFGHVYRQGEPSQKLPIKYFVISFQDTNDFYITNLSADTLTGTLEQYEKGRLLLDLPPETIRADFQPLNVIFNMVENRTDRQSWTANGSGLVENEPMYYYIYWDLYRLE